MRELSHFDIVLLRGLGNAAACEGSDAADGEFEEYPEDEFDSKLDGCGNAAGEKTPNPYDAVEAVEGFLGSAVAYEG